MSWPRRRKRDAEASPRPSLKERLVSIFLLAPIFVGLIVFVVVKLFDLSIPATIAIFASMAIGIPLLEGMVVPGVVDEAPLSPAQTWRNDWVLGGIFPFLVTGSAFGIIRLEMEGSRRFAMMDDELLFLLTAGFFWATWIALSRTWAIGLAFLGLALFDRTPVRLLRFLEDARQREVLRTVGSVYEFRHVLLQEQLAGNLRGAAASSAPAPTPGSQ